MKSFFKTITKKQIAALAGVLVLAGALTAGAFELPTSGPTANNTRDPIHIGIADQIKDGGMSVFTFQSRGDARLEQNAIFKGTVRGGLPTDSTSTVTSASDTDVTGLLRAKEYLNSVAISHPGDTNAKPLCSDKTGTIGLCTAISALPSFIEITMVPNTTQSAPYTTQFFWIGPIIPPGSQYNLALGNTFIMNAVPGDTAHNLALKMVTYVNSKTKAQWDAYWPTGSTPPASGPGYPPRATMVGDSSFKITAYPGHSFAAYATSQYPSSGGCGDMVDGKLIECTKGNPVQVTTGVDISDLHYCDTSYIPTFYVKPPAWGVNEGAEVYTDEYMRSGWTGSYIRQYPGSAIHSMNGNVVGPIVDWYDCF